MNAKKRTAAAIGLGAIPALAIAACGTTSTSASVNATSQAPPASTAPRAASHPPIQDVMRIQIVTSDLGYGVTETKANYTIVNHSSKESDYIVDYDVLKNGVRVDHSTVFENNVQPGQTVTGSDLLQDSDNGGTVANIQVNRTSTNG